MGNDQSGFDKPKYGTAPDQGQPEMWVKPNRFVEAMSNYRGQIQDHVKWTPKFVAAGLVILVVAPICIVSNGNYHKDMVAASRGRSLVHFPQSYPRDGQPRYKGPATVEHIDQ